MFHSVIRRVHLLSLQKKDAKKYLLHWSLVLAPIQFLVIFLVFLINRFSFPLSHDERVEWVQVHVPFDKDQRQYIEPIELIWRLLVKIFVPYTGDANNMYKTPIALAFKLFGQLDINSSASVGRIICTLTRNVGAVNLFMCNFVRKQIHITSSSRCPSENASADKHFSPCLWPSSTKLPVYFWSTSRCIWDVKLLCPPKTSLIP